MHCVLTIAGAMLLLASGVAEANPLKSLYTTIELSACRATEPQSGPRTWSCPGLEGAPLSVTSREGRVFVSAGPRPEARRAARQALTASATLFPAGAARATVEWRVRRLAGKTVPHATILRYFTSLGARKGQVLVVMRIGSAESCHVAYIDALANPEGIALARRIADLDAPKFDCAREPVIAGRRGQSPM